MTTPGPGNTSDTARLLVDPPGFAVGWYERLLVPAPAAGQGLTYVVDGRFFERMLTLTFTLSTSAVVANRFAQLFLEDNNGLIVSSVPCSGTVVASQVLNVFLAWDGVAYSFGSSGGTYGKLPDLIVPPGWKWVVSVFGADAADQLSAVVASVQRFPNDSVAISAG